MSFWVLGYHLAALVLKNRTSKTRQQQNYPLHPFAQAFIPLAKCLRVMHFHSILCTGL